MPELLSDFFRWLLAVAKVYYGWLAGSSIAAILGLGEKFEWWHPSKQTYIALIVIGILFSMFQAWREEHTLAAGVELPALEVTIVGTYSIYRMDDDVTCILCALRIINRGANSAVSDYKAIYKNADGTEENADLAIFVEEKVNFPGYVFRRDDAINFRTEVVTRGEVRVGRLPILLKGNRQADVSSRAGVLEIQIKDYLGRRTTTPRYDPGPATPGKLYVHGEPVAPSPRNRNSRKRRNR